METIMETAVEVGREWPNNSSSTGRDVIAIVKAEQRPRGGDETTFRNTK
jgi:hypothetical protein